MKIIKLGLSLIILLLITAACLPASPPTAMLVDDCIEVDSAPAKTPSGVIALQDAISTDIMLLDLKTGQKKSFGEAVSVMAVSPDSKQLAYTDKISGQLIILASNGNHQETISVPDEWIGVIRWVTADSLLMEKFIYTPYGPASSVIYDLKTEEKQEFSLNYPNMEGFSVPPQWDNYSYTRTIYDPSFTRVVYPAIDERAQGLLILLDLETKREVVIIHRGSDPDHGGAPQWFRDGSSFIAGIYPQYQVDDSFYNNITDDLPYKGGYELVRVSRDGKLQRLTYLTTKYQAGEEAFSLSPDENHIAFWLNLNYTVRDLDADRTLAILNIPTGEISNLCLAGGTTPVPPIWSQDGKYLLVTRYYRTGDLLSDVVLVDLDRKNATKIAENAVAKGWLEK